MAIDHILHPEAHNLAHAEKGFYPVKIPVSHWQLRHYISTPEPGLLYYASGKDVYCLNTTSKKRKHIASLPFEARCTASGHGWVCVGGEQHGNFAAIKLDGGAQAQQRDVDAALPIDERWRSSGVGRRAASVKIESSGEEIVNSISIHRIQDEEAHLDDIVAVLTNNDKTVRIYSLPSGQETRVKGLPYAMNHATISPDGQTLVAVGDYNQAYFFNRVLVDDPPQIPKPHNRLTSASVDWELVRNVTLYVSSPEATIGFFTTAWSPNGRLVAVGSEGGYIAVFDMDVLADPDFEDDDDSAVVAMVPGSRANLPSPHPGAVRSMLFSPEPWDLLIWAEDQGRICVGDLRTALKSRQVVHLDPKDDTLRNLTFQDVPPDVLPEVPLDAPALLTARSDDLDIDLLRRYRAGTDSATEYNFAAEYLEARRRQQQRRSDVSARSQHGTTSSRSTPEDDPQGLTAREQQVLETLRTARQREEARSNGHASRSVNYTSADLFAGSSGSRFPTSLPSTTEATRPINDILTSVQESFPELSRTHAASPRPSSSHAPDPSSPLPPLHALQDGVWGSTRGSSGFPRLGDTSRLPRRQASVVLSSVPSQTTDGAPATTIMSSNRTPSDQSSTLGPADADEEHPWRIIQEQMSTGAGPLFESVARAQATSPLPATDRQGQTDLQNELDIQQRIRVAQQQQRQRERERVRSIRSTGVAATTASATNSGTTADRPPTVLLEARRPAPFPDGYETLLRRTQMRALSGREVGVRTAGLAISSDGSTVWAACEQGIFEVRLRLKGRMFWPALDPR